MSAFAPAGFGGRCRYEPAALPLCAQNDPVHPPAVIAAGSALLVTLLLTGFALPQVEWFALPERIDEMRERPREFWGHFVALLLALCGLDAVSDVAGVVRKRTASGRSRSACAIVVKAAMVHALLVLAIGSLLSDPQLGDRQVNLPPLLPTDYVGQWAELAVAVLGDVLLLVAVHAAGAAVVEARSKIDGTGASETPDPSSEVTPAACNARHDG